MSHKQNSFCDMVHNNNNNNNMNKCRMHNVSARLNLRRRQSLGAENGGSKVRMLSK